MKKVLCIILSIVTLSLLCFTSCGEDNGDGGNGGGKKGIIDENVVGTWYATLDGIKLEIEADGTGAATVSGEKKDAEYSTKDGIFTAKAEHYNLSGKYTVENELMTVEYEEAGAAYKIIFQKKPFEIEASTIYEIDGKYYELTLKGGGITIGEREFPPKDDVEYKDIPIGGVILPPEDTESEDEEIIVVVIYRYPGKPDEPDIPDDAIPTQIIINVEMEITLVFPGPEGGPEKEVPGLKNGGSIVGTWTTEPQEGHIYIMGFETETDSPSIYTFNEDGTGQVTTMGKLTFPLTYTFKNNVLTLSVTALGETETGSGYAQIIGNVLYVANDDGEIQALSRQGVLD